MFLFYPFLFSRIDKFGLIEDGKADSLANSASTTLRQAQCSLVSAKNPIIVN